MCFLTISFTFIFWTDFQPTPFFDDLPQGVGSVFPAWTEPDREGPAVGGAYPDTLAQSRPPRSLEAPETGPWAKRPRRWRRQS